MALSIEKEALPVDVRVLVVDGDVILLHDIQQMCHQFNYSVTTCSKASDALDLLRERNNYFNVLVVEAEMPNVDSDDFLQHVIQQNKIPFIVMSTDRTPYSATKAITNGACEYWIKPLHEEKIQNMWQHVLRKVVNANKQQEIINDKKLKESNSKEIEANCVVENDNDKYQPPTKKARVTWKTKLHQKFVRAVNELGINKAVPTKIHELMNVPGLTRAHVASHLQKYRIFLKREETKQPQQQSGTSKAMESNNSYDYQEFDFQAYYGSIATPVEVPTQCQNYQNDLLKYSTPWPNISHSQQNSIPYNCNSHQTFNNIFPLNYPHQSDMLMPPSYLSSLRYGPQFCSPSSSNTLALQQEHHVQQSLMHSMNDVHNQTSKVVSGSTEEENSAASVSQNFGGFGSNYVINSSVSNINAHDQNNQGGNIFSGCNIPHQLPMSSLAIGGASRSSRDVLALELFNRL